MPLPPKRGQDWQGGFSGHRGHARKNDGRSNHSRSVSATAPSPTTHKRPSAATWQVPEAAFGMADQGGAASAGGSASGLPALEAISEEKALTAGEHTAPRKRRTRMNPIVRLQLVIAANALLKALAELQAE